MPEENILESGDVVVLNVVDESPSSISEIYNTIQWEHFTNLYGSQPELVANGVDKSILQV